MKHFAAYHNVDKMGHPYEPSEDFGIYSKKALKFLETAIGETVWLINGAKQGSAKLYTLCAVFTPDQIIDSEGEFDYLICGSSGSGFNPPIVLNNLSWFPQFLKNQTNFSLGINVILDEEAISGLTQLAGNELQGLNFTPNDIDAFDSEGSEGSRNYVTHLRRERNKSLITAKKENVLDEHGQLRCEACGFDFHSFYGELGKGFCEVHHKIPLSTIEGNRITKLSDLAVLCSNCHRVIHRTTPMPSVPDLNEHINSLRIQPRRPEGLGSGLQSCKKVV